MYLNLRIKVPNIIEYIFLFFLLRYRKRRFGFAFRKIKLLTNEKVDKKYRLVGSKQCEDRYAIVDADDFAKISQYPWQVFISESKRYYAARLDNRQITHMHRVIMKAPRGTIVDHINRNGLDNTKRNLRFATPAQNACNRVNRRKGSSKYRGVRLDNRRKKWRAQISCNRILRHLGCFDDEEAAGRAYDEAARIYHGEFAVLNFGVVDKPPR